jgi:hypothetical protein
VESTLASTVVGPFPGELLASRLFVPGSPTVFVVPDGSLASADGAADAEAFCSPTLPPESLIGAGPGVVDGGTPLPGELAFGPDAPTWSGVAFPLATVLGFDNSFELGEAKFDGAGFTSMGFGASCGGSVGANAPGLLLVAATVPARGAVDLLPAARAAGAVSFGTSFDDGDAEAEGVGFTSVGFGAGSGVGRDAGALGLMVGSGGVPAFPAFGF